MLPTGFSRNACDDICVKDKYKVQSKVEGTQKNATKYYLKLIIRGFLRLLRNCNLS